MTTGVGYPDWQSPQAAQSNLLYSISNTVVADNTVFGPFASANYPRLIATLTCMGPARITVTYYHDQAMTQVISGYTHDINTSQILARSFPVLGPWVTIRLDFVGATETVLAHSVHLAAVSLMDGVVIDHERLFVVDQIVSAGATILVEPAKAYAGPAVLSIASNAAVWDGNIESGDLLSTFTKTVRTGAAVQGSGIFSIYLPPLRTRFRYTNGDAGARTITAILTAGE